MLRWTTVLCFLIAGQAHALSCMRLTPEHMFTWAHQSEKLYVPVYGQFDVKPVKRKQTSQNELPKGFETKGTFSGKFVTGRGFGQELTTSVTVNVTCAAHWCGGTPGDGTVLAVLEKRGTEYVLHQNACPSSTLHDPDTAQLNAFRKCLRRGACSSDR